jgi:hypothetical protein
MLNSGLASSSNTSEEKLGLWVLAIDAGLLVGPISRLHNIVSEHIHADQSQLAASRTSSVLPGLIG